MVMSIALIMEATMAGTITAATFTPSGMLLEQAPSGHTVGKDNGTDTGASQGNATHMAGNDCGICHKPDGKAGSYVFSMAGTVYKDKAGTMPLSDAEIILQDAEGNIISMTSNSVGNFFTYAPIAGDPAYGSDLESSRNWRYKAWVKYGDFTRHMVTLAGVGGSSSTTARMSCNMHHGWQGSRGSLTTGDFAVLSSYPSSGISFYTHVLPVLKNCMACHKPGSISTITSYGDEKYDYGAGLDLSAYEKDAKSSRGIPDIVNVSEPDQSLILLKTTVGGIHAGGSFWNQSSADYQLIRRWIAEGALNN